MNCGAESMTRTDLCLLQIASIREVAAGDAAAYVARSRVGRFVLTLAALLAEEAGLRVPDTSAPVLLPDGSPSELQEMANHCNSLLELARHIVQPSEPLAVRWTRGWEKLLFELEILERHLLSRRSDA
jgi:hypothetical protein